MEASLFRYIWTQSRREQIWILFIILASMPFSFIMLDLPKYIVNGPIQAKGFEQATSTQHYFQIKVPVPASLKGDGFIEVLHGFDLNRVWSLVVLSALFLLLVVVTGLFKYYINFYKGRLGERMLGQLRYELIDRVLRFPPTEFRRVKGAEVATMIKDEVEPLGGFIGDAFVQPVFLGGQILTSIVFILIQNFALGGIALALLLVQGIVIPRLRRKQLVLGRQRQLTARALAGRIGEIVDDISNIHTNDASDYQRADIATRLTKIFSIRFALYQWKFFVKFLNNLLAQITPFLFYMVGGFLAIWGLLDIGQLVAVISAYKDLPSPVKDLIDWDQQRLDVEVKYTQVIEQFSVDPSVELLPPPDYNGPIPDLSGEIVFTGVTVLDGSGLRLLDNLSLRFGVGELTAIRGGPTGGGESLIGVLSRLVWPDAGRVTIGERDVREIPLSVTGRRFSYVTAETFFPQSTVAEALYYGIRHAKEPQRKGRHDIIKSRGNNLDFDADWIDCDAAGARDLDDLVGKVENCLSIVALANDIIAFGLARRLAVTDEDVEARFVQARAIFRDKLGEADMVQLVEAFDPERYNGQSSIAENLVFGTPLDESFNLKQLGSNPVIRKALSADGLDATLFDLGKTVAETIIEVFDGLDAESPLFEQLSLMTPEQFPDYQAALKRVGSRRFKQASSGDQAVFLDLAFGYIEPRDRLGLLDDELRDKLLRARHAFHAALGDNQDKIAFYHPDRYNQAATIKDNVLMGRVAFGIAEAENRVSTMVRDIVDELSLRSVVFRAGLEFNIGNGGKRLSAAQRQKLAMARAILRRPDLLLVHRGLVQIDGHRQEEILSRIVEESRGGNGRRGFGILWDLEGEGLTSHFNRIITMDNGRIVDDTISSGDDGSDAEAEPMQASA